MSDVVFGPEGGFTPPAVGDERTVLGGAVIEAGEVGGFGDERRVGGLEVVADEEGRSVCRVAGDLRECLLSGPGSGEAGCGGEDQVGAGDARFGISHCFMPELSWQDRECFARNR